MIARNLLLCGLLLAVPAFAQPAPPQPALPDTPAGHAFTAYLDAINTDDPAKVDAFIHAYHPDSTAENFFTLHRATGGFSVIRVEKDGPGAITVLMKEKDSDNFARSTFTMTPGHLTMFAIQVPRPPEYAIPRLGEAAALKAVQDYAGGLAAQDKFSGALLIVRHGKMVLEKSWGMADREQKIPNTPNTKFRVGSMGKMFTSIAVLQLIQDGKLSLDGTVGKYLPAYPDREIAAKVTIRQLLAHTGGTGNFRDFDGNLSNLKSVADYVNICDNRVPLFEPGTKDDYSNCGFIILGYIVEKVSGLSYYDYVQEHIFDPAGMRGTGFLPEDQEVEHRAVGYTWKDGKWVSAANTLPYRGSPAGGGYSTVGDMVKFVTALQSGKLISTRMLQDATTPHDHHKDYGYGFGTYGDGLLFHYGHNGGAYGTSGNMQVYPRTNTIAVALANLDPAVADHVVGFYLNRMPAD